MMTHASVFPGLVEQNLLPPGWDGLICFIVKFRSSLDKY